MGSACWSVRAWHTRGLARKRFQRLLLNSNQAREATNMWEQNLNNLASAITPQTPRDDVWVNILQRIENRPQTSKTVIHTKPSIWRTWSFVATAACIVLAFCLFSLVPMLCKLSKIALVQNQDKQSLWFIDVSEQGLSIKASSQLVAQTNKDYELWMILKGQDAPISLGLLPSKAVKYYLKITASTQVISHC
ncbi:anti-sigma factor [Pseudoalteromonas sp. B193]